MRSAHNHGMYGTAEFGICTDIQTRCYNKNHASYKNYGARGITVCDRWLSSFPTFLSDMGIRPSNELSIDRNNVDGNYETSNCRWATKLEQANNKRNTVRITINGETKTLQEWCRERGAIAATVWVRHKQGITGNDLFNTTCMQVTHNGVSDTVSGWSKRTGIKATTLTMRLTKYQWPVSKALTKGVNSCA